MTTKATTCRKKLVTVESLALEFAHYCRLIGNDHPIHECRCGYMWEVVGAGFTSLGGPIDNGKQWHTERKR